MIRVISFLLFSLIFFSCEDSSEKNLRLKKENKELEIKNFSLSRKNRSLEAQNLTLEKNLNEKKIYLEGETPKYLITLKIIQPSIALNIREHVKNSLNSFEITIETTREFYNRVKIGDKLNKKFKSESFWINGNVEHLVIKIKDKKVVSKL